MRNRFLHLALQTASATLILSSFGWAAAKPARPAAVAAQSTHSAPHITAFEQNMGRVDAQIKFYSYSPEGITFFTIKRFVTGFAEGAPLSFTFEGDSAPEVQGVEELPPVVAPETAAGTSAADLPGPMYAKVKYAAAFPGIDLSLWGAGAQLQYEFDVTKDSDASSIALRVDGATSMAVQPDGSLIINATGGDIHWNRPQAFQEYLDRGLVKVPCAYVVENGRLRLQVGKYDHQALLVIRPDDGQAPPTAARPAASATTKTKKAALSGVHPSTAS